MSDTTPQTQPAPDNGARQAAPYAEPTETEAYLTVRALLDTGIQAGEPADVWIPGEVGTVRSETHRLRQLLDPREIERPFNQALFRSIKGKATLSLVRPREVGDDPTAPVFDDPMTLTRSARRQLAGQVLPGHGLSFVDGLRQTGQHGRKLADVNWNHLLQSSSGKTPLLRTVRFPGEPVRTIRAVLSQRYAIVDNVDVLDAVMDCADARNLPVISVKITEDALRIRLCLDPTLTDAEAMAAYQAVKGYRPGAGAGHNFGDFAGKPVPVPMIEVWNSETGHAAVGARAGFYEVLCSNGMVGFGGGANWRWTHQGGTSGADRIRDGLGSALTSARVLADGFIESFQAAQKVAIDDAFALLTSWGSKDLTKTQTARVNEAMKDPTSGQQGTLGNLLSGITLAAQAEDDLFAQLAMESLAAGFLHRGLEAAGEAGVIRNLRGEKEIAQA